MLEGEGMGWKTLATGIFIASLYGGVVSAAPVVPGNVKQAREAAVVEARNGNLNSAGAKLGKLYKAHPQDTAVLFDYVTVLSWNSKHVEVLNVYEQHPFLNGPDYALRSVASAYARTTDTRKNFAKALMLLQAPMEHADLEAYRIASQIYIQQNKIKEAIDIFDKLEALRPNVVSTYRFKAETCTQVSYWDLAAFSWKKAWDVYKTNPDPNIREVTLIDNYTACLIRHGDLVLAKKVLEDCMERGLATSSIYGNYMSCLNRLKKYAEAEHVYFKHFKDFASSPIFVLRELGTSYERRNISEKATDVYRFVLQFPQSIPDDKYKFAYNATQAHKYRAEGLAMYQELLAKPELTPGAAGPIRTQRILDNAHEFLRKGEIEASEGVYKLLTAHDKRFARIYADDFYGEGFNQTAMHVYQQMEKDPELRHDAQEGIVKTSVALEDYQRAAKYNTILTKAERGEDEHPMAAGYFKNKYTGNNETTANYYKDKEKTEVIEVKDTAEQWAGGPLWIRVDAGLINVKDPNEYAVNRKKIIYEELGVEYKARKVKASMGIAKYQQDGQGTRPSFSVEWQPTDLQNVSLTYEDKPVYSARALNEGHGIFSKNLTLRYEHDISQLEKYWIEVGKGWYDDHNSHYFYDVGQWKLLYFMRENGKTLERRLHYGRNAFADNSDFYYSPDFNENFGGEWRWGKDFDRHSRFYHIWGFDWDRDRGENLALTPYYRFEFVQRIDNNHEFVLGTTHKFRANHWYGGGPYKYDYHSVDAQYRFLW